MLQVAFIRQNTELVKQKLSIRNYQHLEIVDEILLLDDEVKNLKNKIEHIQTQVNSKSDEVQKLMKNNQKEEALATRNEVASLKESLANEKPSLEQAIQSLEAKLILLPNLPHNSVPAGTTPEENEIVREGGTKPTLHKDAVPHWELAKKYDLINFELGNKITGSGFPVYKNKGAKFQRALIQYFLDYNTSAGYIEYMPPLMVNESSAYGTGQLPDKEGQMYHVTLDGYYLIPTAEVPVTNIYRDEILKESELPVKMTAYTPCFRREAGSYGKDVRGLNRLHQFDKVEIIQLAHPDKSYDVIEEMVTHVEKLLQSLELPYRLLRLCGGDMGFTSALTYDFEVYSAAQEKWLEVSSVSNFETFQSNRMKIRFKPALPAGRNQDNKTQLVHSLNGSSLALPRIVAALLENNQNENGIQLPKVLHNYFGASTIEI